MAEQKALLTIDVNLAGVEKERKRTDRERDRRQTRERGRRGGVTVVGAGAAGAAAAETRGAGLAVISPTPLARRESGIRIAGRTAREKIGKVAKFGGVLRGGFQNTIRAIPLVGGALAAGLFASMNAEKLAFFKGAAPDFTPLGFLPATGIAKAIKTNIVAAGETVSDVVNIAKAFAAIGEPPPGKEFGETIGLLAKANKAQAIFKFDIQEELYRSAGSTVKETIKKGAGRDVIEGLLKQLTAGSYK